VDASQPSDDAVDAATADAAGQPSAALPVVPVVPAVPAADSPDAALRASDADRERGAALLRAAVADGRLAMDELDGRLESVYAAKSRGELAAVVQDLRPAARAGGAGRAAKDVAVLGDFVREGHWVVGERYASTAVIGSGVIDLREAELTGPEATVHVTAWISTVYVVVPEGVEVTVAGRGILGAFQDRAAAGAPAAHRIVVTGLSVLGNVHVVRQLPEAKARRLRQRKRRSIGG
jgi:hypothetical protein